MWLPLKTLFVILHILAFPLNVIVVLIFLIYHYIIVLISKIFQNFVSPIPGASKVFLGDRIWTKPHSSIVAAVELQGDKGPVELQKIAQNFQTIYNLRDAQGQRCYRELAYYPVNYYGYGFWGTCPDFHCKEQIEYLPEDFKDDPLPSVVEKLLRFPYDEERPLWNVYLQPLSNGNGNKSLMFIRFHHLLADGMSFVKLCHTLFGVKKLPENFTKPKASMQRWDKLSQSFLAKITSALHMLTFGFIDYIDQLLISHDRNRINYNENGKVNITGNWICSIGKPLDVDEIKRASKGLQCSIIHTIIGGLTKGLERYFVKYHNVSKDDPVPDKIHLVFPAPLPKHPDLRLVNHWALAYMDTKFGFTDPYKTIAYLKSETQRAGNSVLPMISAFMFRYMSEILPTYIVDQMSKAKATCTILLSNVVGPQNSDGAIGGAKITGMMFWMPIVQESTAMSMGIISCNGGIRVCFVADVGCIPDRARLEDLGEMVNDEVLRYCKMGKKL